MRIMAIDLGDAHTGIAISDPTGLLAGFTTVLHTRRMEDAAAQAWALAQDHAVEEIVLGHPVNMDGTLGPRSQKTRDFQALLRQTSGLPVTLWDERRTTVDAHRILGEQGIRAKNRKDKIDSVAATLILEGYLDFRRIAAARARREEDDHA